jgi:hypothetical protein
MSNQSEPATKQDLADLAADLTANLTTTLASKDDLAKLASKDDLAEAVSKMADDLAAMEKRLVLAIWHAANVMIEQIGAKFAAIVEKYDGPLRQVSMQDPSASPILSHLASNGRSLSRRPR